MNRPGVAKGMIHTDLQQPGEQLMQRPNEIHPRNREKVAGLKNISGESTGRNDIRETGRGQILTALGPL